MPHEQLKKKMETLFRKHQMIIMDACERHDRAMRMVQLSTCEDKKCSCDEVHGRCLELILANPELELIHKKIAECCEEEGGLDVLRSVSIEFLGEKYVEEHCDEAGKSGVCEMYCGCRRDGEVFDRLCC